MKNIYFTVFAAVIFLSAGKSFAYTDYGISDPKTMTIGASYACYLQSSQVRCTGTNYNGALGNPSVAVASPSNPLAPFISTPVVVSLIGSPVAVSAGKTGACAVLSNGKISCWGGSSVNYAPPTAVQQPVIIGSFTTARQVSVGYSINDGCALLSTGAVSCWGRVSPSNISGATQVSVGDNSLACALMPNTTVQCWGNNTQGGLGVAPTQLTASSDGRQIPNLSLVKKVVVSNKTACALMTNKTVKCWGSNENYLLGRADNAGTTIANPVPLAVPGLAGVEDIALDPQGAGACAIILDGTVKCWGGARDNYVGQASTQPKWVPLNLPLFAVAAAETVDPGYQIRLSNYNGCASLARAPAGIKVMRCWGSPFNY